MLETRKGLKERITALEAQIALNSDDVEAASNATTEAEALAQKAIEEATEAKAELASVVAELEEATAGSAKLAEQLAEANASIAELQDEDQRIAEAAVAELAAVGHEPVESVATAQTWQLSREDYEAQSAAITDPIERAKFRLANMDRVKN